MGFFTRMQMALARFMAGRNGMDNMAYHALWGGLICSLLSIFLPLWGITSLLSTALFIYCLFRVLSRSVEKRRAENLRYIQAAEKRSRAFQQFKVRWRNRKTYKYFRCPGCKKRLRMRRGSGVKPITCPMCQRQFTKKA